VKRLIFFLLFCSCTPAAVTGAAGGSPRPSSLRILFTSDLHSNFLPQSVLLPDGSRETRGGYARLATAVRIERSGDSLGTVFVDAGDFSMGTLFHTLFVSEGAELQLMSAMQYDVMTFGNHDFDFRLEGLAHAIDSARLAVGRLPTLVASNFALPSSLPVSDETEASFFWSNIREAVVIERNGLRVGIFGLMGRDAASDVQFTPTIVFDDPVVTARRVVDSLRTQAHVDLVICLSHSGTSPMPRKSEDEELAKDVQGIDVIVSGHTHRVLEQPLRVGKTLIVAAGANGASLGVLDLAVDRDGVRVAGYKLDPIDGRYADDPKIGRMVNRFEHDVETRYLAPFGLKFDQAVAESPFDFETIASAYAHPGELGLGNLITDAFRFAVHRAEGPSSRPVDVVIEPLGMIRGSFLAGPITVADVFRVLSLGLGPDGKPGYPLVTTFVRGSDLMKILEIEASVSTLKEDAHLEFSGVKFAYNPFRLPFNRVMWAELTTEDGRTRPIHSDSLYRVCLNLYTAVMVSNIRQLSYGFASIQGLDSAGRELGSSLDAIVDGDRATPGVQEIKEWIALEEYLQSFPRGPRGLPVVPATYHGVQGRIVVDATLNPLALFRNPNEISLIATALFVTVAGGILYLVIRKRRSRGRRNSH
jgi:5'-nucleotidase/UDP-sugar diphosphatase